MRETPTAVRYRMIALTTLVAVMLYLDRVCLSIVGEQLRPNLGIDETEFAWLMSSFFWAYALFQLPAGWLGDRYGPRRMLAIYLFFWSACTGLMGLAMGFFSLLVLRLGCGMFEAGAYPLAAGIVSRWMPFSTRGTASGFVAVGGRLGGAIAPVLTAFLAGGLVSSFGVVGGGLAVPGVWSLDDGWRRPFLLYGAIGMVGAVIFRVWFRDRPIDHPAVNDAEAALIRGSGDPTRDDGRALSLPPIGQFVRHRAMWLCSLVQFLSNFAWVFIITLFPLYLTQVFQTPVEQRAWYQSMPLYAGIFGMLLGGWISDKTTARYGLRWGRAIPVAGSRVLVGAAYAACLLLDSPLYVTIMMCLVAFATDMGTAPVWAWGQDIGGRYVGAAIGWANMWGNFGAAIAPLVLLAVKRQFDDPTMGWNAAFLLCAATQVLAAVAALGMDGSRKIVER